MIINPFEVKERMQAAKDLEAALEISNKPKQV